MARRVLVGTSGWHYAHWVGPFYPAAAKAKDFLDLYCKSFDAVEINNTFYRMPGPDTLAAWREATPPQFVFACKASRYITHMKKLKDPAPALLRLLDGVGALGAKLGPILFQLPPHWHVDATRLRDFLAVLPADHRYAVEFRDRSWLVPAVYDALRDHNVALCAYDFDGFRSPVQTTADFVYVRLHGPDGPYCGRYDGRTLSGWARRFQGWIEEGRDVYCFFDNDERGYAATDALRTRRMIARRFAADRRRR